MKATDDSQLTRHHFQYAGVSFFCSSGLEGTGPRTRRRPEQEEEEWEEEETEEVDRLFVGTLDDAAAAALAAAGFSEVLEVDQVVEVMQELHPQRLQLQRRPASPSRWKQPRVDDPELQF